MEEEYKYLPLPAIIPYEIRYNQNITSFAKMLYAEISIYKDFGGCELTNNELGKIFTSPQTRVKRHLNSLIKENLIERQIISDNDNKFVCRKLIARG
jgi:DNA-binding MarR family transcriptional regulator